MLPSRTLSLFVLFSLPIFANFSGAVTVACEKENLAEVKRLMSAGASKDEKHIALRSASKNGHANVVNYLISQGAPLGDRDFPPLIDAEMQGHAEVVRLLLRAGASIDEGDQASTLCLTVKIRRWSICSLRPGPTLTASAILRHPYSGPQIIAIRNR